MLQLAALHPITGPVAAPPAMLSATKKSDCSLASCSSPLPCPWEVAQLADREHAGEQAEPLAAAIERGAPAIAQATSFDRRCPAPEGGVTVASHCCR